MSSVNKVILVGRLGRDPEVRAMQSGDSVCNMSLATSESWKDKNSGERKEKTEWHRIVWFKPHGLVDHLHKGAMLYIEGQVQTRKWQDQEGTDRYSTEIVLNPYRSVIDVLDWGPNSPRRENGSRPSMNDPQHAGVNQAAVEELDDQVPF